MDTKGSPDTSRTAASDEPITVVPGKPNHRIVIVSPEVAYYEHVDTGERTPITIPWFARATLAAQIHAKETKA